jgi:hypothetical protein
MMVRQSQLMLHNQQGLESTSMKTYTIGSKTWQSDGILRLVADPVWHGLPGSKVVLRRYRAMTLDGGLWPV